MTAKKSKSKIIATIILAAIAIVFVACFSPFGAVNDERFIVAIEEGNEPRNIAASAEVLRYIDLNANGQSEEHVIDVTDKCVYSLDGAAWQLNSGEQITIKLRYKDMNFPVGQGIEVGYLVDGNPTSLYSGQAKTGVVIDFDVVNSGEYYFYVRCGSSDPLQVEYIKIS